MYLITDHRQFFSVLFLLKYFIQIEKKNKKLKYSLFLYSKMGITVTILGKLTAWMELCLLEFVS